MIAVKKKGVIEMGGGEKRTHGYVGKSKQKRT